MVSTGVMYVGAAIRSTPESTLKAGIKLNAEDNFALAA